MSSRPRKRGGQLWMKVSYRLEKKLGWWPKYEERRAAYERALVVGIRKAIKEAVCEITAG